MNKYISHFYAVDKWDIPNLDNVLGPEIKKANLNGSKKSYTVFNPAARYTCTESLTHSCTIKLPQGAIVKHKGEFISSPELVFLELANELDMHRLILLGLQMCSHPAGKPSEAISNKRKLEDLIKRTAGHRGQTNARFAIKHIENGASSIVESIIFMLLTLPHSYGGFGFKNVKMNYEILLNAEARKILNQSRCFVDFYFPEAKLAIEYDSLTHHGDATSQGKDQIRATALERQGIDVIRFTTIQLYKKILFDEFILNLSSRLEKRLRIRAKCFKIRHKIIRELLPTNNN